MHLWPALLLLLPLACRQSMVSTAVSDDEAVADWTLLYSWVVTDDGLVDYDALEADRDVLDRYVSMLADNDSWRGRATKDWHARWLNAYNALTMFQVLERGRPDSVLTPRRLLPMSGAAFFIETQFKLGPDWLSLSEIEHQRVRQKELDIRDHAALNCASMSCPPLSRALYRSGSLRAQLDNQMTRWVMDPKRGVRIEEGQAVFNPIFDWYGRDFHFWTVEMDLCAIAAQYANGKKKAALNTLSASGCPHRFFEYDWTLNDASAR